jgi:hypothetical protein
MCENRQASRLIKYRRRIREYDRIDAEKFLYYNEQLNAL